MAGAQEKFSAASVTAGMQKPDLSQEREDDAAFNSVSTPEYLNYKEKLAVYEARSDTEPLADRRARDNGELFSDADFAREADYEGVRPVPAGDGTEDNPGSTNEGTTRGTP